MRLILIVGMIITIQAVSRADNVKPHTKEPTTEAECKQKHGKWAGMVNGRGRLTGCLLPTSDAGKSCTDSSQCESECVRGKCYEWSRYKGCGIMTQGKDLCAD